MLEILNDYDWDEVFKYATPAWVPESKASGVAAPFTRDDVAEVIGKDEGENDGAEWIMAGRLNDERWFFIAAGCDYTGWGCQEGGHSVVADTREQLERLGMTQEERARMKLDAPELPGLGTEDK